MKSNVPEYFIVGVLKVIRRVTLPSSTVAVFGRVTGNEGETFVNSKPVVLLTMFVILSVPVPVLW